LIFVFHEHRQGWTAKNFRGLPDLVVEILSPGSIRTDRVKKLKLYAAYGIPEYWIISPGKRTIEILTLRAGQYEQAGLYEEGDSLQSSLLAGFTCAVTEIFAEE
jgi:Uma2 family endonuclease